MKKALLPLIALGSSLVVSAAFALVSPIKSAPSFADVSNSYREGWSTAEEVQAEMVPNAGELTTLIDVGTYGRPIGADELKLADLWQYLNNDKLQHFRMMLLYNVAERGPLAQTVRIYTRPAGAVDPRINLADLRNWKHEATWPISSGANHKFRSLTGIYKVHPDRVSLNAQAWGANDPMPHAMYLHYRYCAQNRWTGMATHGTPFEQNLGTRASSGCLRLARANAKGLWERVTREFRGPVPVTNFCNGTQQAPGSAHLEMVKENGRTVMQDGFQVLFVIHDDANPAF